jgi:hypothetical protein
VDAALFQDRGDLLAEQAVRLGRECGCGRRTEQHDQQSVDDPGYHGHLGPEGGIRPQSQTDSRIPYSRFQIPDFIPDPRLNALETELVELHRVH